MPSVASIGASNGVGVAKFLAAGTPIRVLNSTPVPHWCEWDDDRGRTAPPVKKRLLASFFRGDKGIRAEIAWVTSESVRDELTRKGRVKVKVKEASGITLTFTAPIDNIQKA